MVCSYQKLKYGMANKNNIYALFLDDIKKPSDIYGDYRHPTIKFLKKISPPWRIARDYWSFARIINNEGVPCFISFDHDLGSNLWNGVDCVKWLISKDIIIADYAVHSANPVGRENIISLMNNWLRHNGIEVE